MTSIREDIVAIRTRLCDRIAKQNQSRKAYGIRPLFAQFHDETIRQIDKIIARIDRGAKTWPIPSKRQLDPTWNIRIFQSKPNASFWSARYKMTDGSYVTRSTGVHVYDSPIAASAAAAFLASTLT